MPLRLQWSRTWDDDKPEDFSCRDGEQQVGRIYSDRAPRGEGKRWRWFLNGQLGSVWLSSSGFEAAKQKAAEALEQAHFRALEKNA